MKPWLARIAFTLVCVAAAAARAAVPTDPDSVLAGTLAEISGAPLSLDDAAAAAAERATAVGEARAALAAAEAARRRERGGFDPEVFASFDESVEEERAATPFAGASVLETDLRVTDVGASVTLPFGTAIEASIETRRNATNSAFSAVNRSYDTAARLDVVQPLLEGFGPAARSALSSAERTRDAARARLAAAEAVVRAGVEQTYWDLYASERAYAVEKLVRDRATAFLELVERRARVGLVGPNQVANARAFLAQEEQRLIDSEEELDATSDRLATLVGERPSSGAPRFRASSQPRTDFTQQPADAVVQTAFERNHDLKALEAQVAALAAEARGARWDALPQLDLVGSLGGNGLSGTVHPVVFGNTTYVVDVAGENFGDSWSEALGRDFPTWSAGVHFRMPLGLRAGRAERDRLNAEVARGRVLVEAQRRDLEERVRAAHRDLANAGRRVQHARDGVTASLEQLRVGELEYQAGRSTAFEIVRLGADLADAARRHSDALVQAARAAAELRRLTSGAYPAP